MSTSPIPPVLDQDRYAVYQPTAATTDFALGFPLFGEAADIAVYLDGNLLALATDYSVRSVSNGATLTPAPVSDAYVRLKDPISAGTLEIFGDFRPRRTIQASAPYGTRDFNFAFSLLMAALREMWSKFTRAIQVPVGEPSLILPNKLARSGQVLGFDNNGKPVAAGDYISISTGAATATAAAASAAASAAAAALWDPASYSTTAQIQAWFKSDGTPSAPVIYGPNGEVVSKGITVDGDSDALIALKAPAGKTSSVHFYKGGTLNWSLYDADADGTFGLYNGTTGLPVFWVDPDTGLFHFKDVDFAEMPTVAGHALVVPIETSAEVIMSGTAVDFTGIPSTASRVHVRLANVALRGYNILLQLGAGAIVTSGYNCTSGVVGASSAGSAAYTTSFLIYGTGTTTIDTSISGVITLERIGGNRWVVSGLGRTAGNFLFLVGGDINLSGALDRVRLSPAASSFLGGTASISWE